MTVSETAGSRPKKLVRHCPKCGSVRVHHSRRRGSIEKLLTALGGVICRCHDCCTRKVWFGMAPLPIGSRDPQTPPWAHVAVFTSVCVASAVAWWVVTLMGNSF